MSISGADVNLLSRICEDKTFLGDSDQIQEQTANILGKISEASWVDIEPENHKLLYFACRQYLGVSLQRQVYLEEQLAKNKDLELVKTIPHDDKVEELDEDYKSLQNRKRRIIEDAIETTSESLSSLYMALFENQIEDDSKIPPIKRFRLEEESVMTVDSTVEEPFIKACLEPTVIRVKKSRKGAPELECKKCGLTCRTPSALNTHWRTHTKIKPFVCIFCGSDHTQKNQLLVHTRTHHPEQQEIVRMRLEAMKKDLKCYCCLVEFKNQKHLTAHIIDCAANFRPKADVIPSSLPSSAPLLQRAILPKTLLPEFNGSA